MRNEIVALLFLYQLPESKVTINNDPRTRTQALITAFWRKLDSIYHGIKFQAKMNEMAKTFGLQHEGLFDKAGLHKILRASQNYPWCVRVPFLK